MSHTTLPPEGSVRQKSDGRWEARLTIGHDLATGRPQVRSRYAKSEEEATSKLWDLYRQREGEGLVPQEVSVLQLFGLFRDSKEHVKKSTLYKLEKEIAPLLVAFGRLKAHKLSRGRVQSAVDALQSSGRSNDSRRRALRTLKATLQYGVDEGYLARNVASSIRLPTARKDVVAKVWTSEEVELFLKVSSGQLQVPYKYKLTAPPRKTVPNGEFIKVPAQDAVPHQMHWLFYVMLATGIRQGEALGLRWKNVDLRAGEIHICEALTSSDGMGAYKLSPPRRPIRSEPSRSAKTLSEH